MRYFRHHFFTRIFWSALAIYLLNMCIDADIPKRESMLAFNEQETLVEFFVEQVLGFENAIDETSGEESSDPEESDLSKKEFLTTPCTACLNNNWIILLDQRLGEPIQSLPAGFQNIFTPPPQHVIC